MMMMVVEAIQEELGMEEMLFSIQRYTKNQFLIWAFQMEIRIS